MALSGLFENYKTERGVIMNQGTLKIFHEKLGDFFKKHPLIAGCAFIISVWGIIGCLVLYLLIFLAAMDKPTPNEAVLSILQWRTLYLLILFSALLYIMDISRKEI